MPDWTDTLAARQAGAQAGFLAHDLPLEEQDVKLGGARVVDPDGARVADPVEDDALDAMTKAELVEEAGRRGVDVPANATKAELVDLLRG